ncbi:MAG: chorismate synthase, partial [Candidatus Omnitrophota bacterium]
MLRFITAGESHGQCLIAVLEGMVSGLSVSASEIDRQLERRQRGYGRGGRMTIEKDRVEILSGVRFGQTIGAPISLEIKNKDFKIDRLPEVKKPRPGHADLVGALKYDRRDARDILERSSARETAARVAVGAVCMAFLENFGVEIFSHVVCLGGVEARTNNLSFENIRRAAASSPVACADPSAAKKMMARIDRTKAARDTLGGVFELLIRGLPPGLGSYSQYDRRLSAQLGAA